MKLKKHKISVCRLVTKTINPTVRMGFATVIGLAFVAVSATYGQVTSIDSAFIEPDSVFQPPIPGSVFTPSSSGNPQNDTLNVSLNEANVGDPGGNGYANQNVWFFSNDGGTTAYNFGINDYFNASFTLTLTGGVALKDMEGGFLFNNPNIDLGYGGNIQVLAVGQGGNAGVVFQGGGTSFNLFAPNGTYQIGTTISMGLNYVVDPNNGLNAFQYSVNNVWATSSPGDTYFDLTAGNSPLNNPWSAGDTLGGYFQIQTTGNVNSPNSGTALFSDISISSVPEPSSLFLLGTGILTLMPRFLRGRRI